jgi:hypothetical protein
MVVIVGLELLATLLLFSVSINCITPAVVKLVIAAARPALDVTVLPLNTNLQTVDADGSV